MLLLKHSSKKITNGKSKNIILYINRINQIQYNIGKRKNYTGYQVSTQCAMNMEIINRQSYPVTM